MGNFGNTDLVGRKTRKWQQIWNCNTYCVNQIFNPNTIFFFLLTGYNKITMLYTYYLHILHNLQAMKMTFLKFFLICKFKGPKLAEKWTNFAKKKEEEFMEFVFPSLRVLSTTIDTLVILGRGGHCPNTIFYSWNFVSPPRRKISILIYGCLK